MTLCTSGPDVIPVASCQFSDNCNCRKRHQTRDPVHPVHDLNDERHKSDNRHCYHHGHSRSQQHHHHNRPNSSSHSHSHHINNDSMNHHLLGHDVVDGPGGVSLQNREREHHGHVLDLQSNNHHHHILHHHFQQHDRSNHSENNNNTARLNGSANRQNLIEQPRVVVEVHQDNNSTSPQPAALSMNNSNSDYDNNRSGSHGDIGEHIRGRLTVPGPQAHLRQSSPRRAARDVSPRRRLSHDLGAHGNHDVDHEIALALRNIGDNLDVRMRNHKEPSVQAVFGACKPTCGQLLVLYLRHHNVMGVTIGATLELLLKFNRM